ncbi:MAG: hypothetical protein VKL59_22290 [Nostocaceae cyanobacterium]|nr:hypothetical protein [Nostocaceae cyanobacterium]
MNVDAVLKAAIVLSKKGYGRKKVMKILNEEGVPLAVVFVPENYLILQSYRDKFSPK